MTGWIAISLGDVTGIGPEVTLKALAAEAASDPFRYLLIGDDASTLRLNQALGLNLPLERFPGRRRRRALFSAQPPCRTARRRSGSRFPLRRARRPGLP